MTLIAQTEGPVLAEVVDGIAILTLNRPDRGNAWTGAMAARYFGLLEDAARSSDVRVIVVSGAGKAFCVGGDGESVGDAAAAGEVERIAKLPYWTPLRIGKPIIAAIDGACFGVGMQQALCCDLRFATDCAKFSTAYARRGLAAEFGMSWLLPRLVGTGHAMDLLLSARLVRMPEALTMGLVNRVVPASSLIEETLAYARMLADKCSPQSMKAVKLQCYADLTSDFLASYDRSERMLAQVLSGADFREGVASWKEGREPSFAPLAGEQSFIAYD